MVERFVYGSDPFAYDFPAAFAAARAREGERARVRVAAANEREFWVRLGWPVPSRERLRRHGERFGREGVDEVAAVYGVDLGEDPVVEAVRSSRRGSKGRMVRPRSLRRLSK
jgi:hypothetical protein